jgi:hypothetical protein
MQAKWQAQIQINFYKFLSSYIIYGNSTGRTTIFILTKRKHPQFDKKIFLNPKILFDVPNIVPLHSIQNHMIPVHKFIQAVRGGAVGWGTVLQAGRSRVRFQMVALEFFIDIILSVALRPWGWLRLYQKWVPGIIPER